jgi:uncharacterized protein DUF6058
MVALSHRDIRYVLTEYRSLTELCTGREQTPAEVESLIAAGTLPAATYVLPSGDPRFPPDYFALVDEAGGVDRLPERFRARYLAAAAGVPTAEADAAEDWAGYLSGQFGVCLWSVTPESMVEKNRLIRRIEALTGAPREADAEWRAELRDAVEALDELVRPFTDFDRQRWGDTSRQRHVDRVRERFPIAFEAHGPVLYPAE